MTPELYLFLATESISGRLEFLMNLKYQTVGILIVMTSLGGLAIIVSLVAAALSPGRAARAAAIEAATPAAEPAAGQIPPEIYAVIAAAVSVTVKIPHEILEVHAAPNPMLSAWSVEGRRQIFQSHSPR